MYLDEEERWGEKHLVPKELSTMEWRFIQALETLAKTEFKKFKRLTYKEFDRSFNLNQVGECVPIVAQGREATSLSHLHEPCWDLYTLKTSKLNKYCQIREKWRN